MASIISTSYVAYQSIRGNIDNVIGEYRDFAQAGVPINPQNTDTYLASSSGSGFTVDRLYVFFNGIFYECLPPKGDIFYDGTNLYQIVEDGTITTLPPNIYTPLDMEGGDILNVSNISSPIGQDSIITSPITFSSYALTNLTSTINSLPVSSGITSVLGFPPVSSNLIGTINNTQNILTIGSNGNYSINLSIIGSAALTPILELSNFTSGEVLGNASAIVAGSGVGVNYIGPLTAGDNIRARVSVLVIGTLGAIRLRVTRLN